MTRPRQCPVCGSEKIAPIKKDSTLAYRCVNGHVFVVRETFERKAETPK